MKNIHCYRCKRRIWQQEDNPWVHSLKCVCSSCVYSSHPEEDYRYEQCFFSDDKEKYIAKYIDWVQVSRIRIDDISPYSIIKKLYKWYDKC